MLTTSERVTLITETARRLSGEGWAVIDLTLGQFGLPTADEWRGDTSSYVIKMTERAADDILVALGAHVGIDVERRSVLEPPFWAKGAFRLFISHVSTIRAYAAELQGGLARYGISAFVAHNDIEPTKEWQNEIETALATCDALVALLTPDFGSSRWTDQEVGFAMGRGVLILSVRLNQDPYGFIGKYQGMNGHKRPADEVAGALFEALLQNKLTSLRVKEGLVAQFEKANSFQEARATMTLLERSAGWPEHLKVRIQAAAVQNYEIANAFTVPGRVRQLVDQKTESA